MTFESCIKMVQVNMIFCKPKEAQPPVFAEAFADAGYPSFGM